LRVSQLANHSFLPALVTPNSVVLDLGVNQGEFAKAVIAEFGCRVIGVEPVPELFEVLPDDHRLTVHRAAITGDGRASAMYVQRADRAANSESATIYQGLSHADSRAIDVDGISLEQLLDRHNLIQVSLAKVDIEGAEIPMLATASTQTLRRVDQFAVEFHDFLDPALAPSVESSKERLRAAGFAEFTFSRGNTDVLFVNRERTRLAPAWRLAMAVRYKYPRGVQRMLARHRATP
jgi:FkbM family methyltransferase